MRSHCWHALFLVPLLLTAAHAALAGLTPPRAEAKKVRMETPDHQHIESLAFSPRGPLLAAGVARPIPGSYGRIAAEVVVWSRRSGKVQLTLQGFPSEYQAHVEALAFSPKGDRLIAGSSQPHGGPGELRVWSMPSGKLLRVTPLRSNTLHVRLTPDGRLAGVISGDDRKRRIDVIDVDSGRRVDTLEDPALAPEALALSPDGATLAVQRHDANLFVWDRRTRRRSPLFSRNTRLPVVLPSAIHILSVGWKPRSPDADLQEIYRWKADSQRLDRVLVTGVPEIRALTVSSDGKRAAALAANGLTGAGQPRYRVHLLDAANGSPLGTHDLNGHARALAFAPDGASVAVGVEDRLEIWHTGTEETPR